MACPTCEVIDQDACQCSLIESDCFTIDGSGSETNPFTVSANFDPDTNNLLSCSAAGILAQLPTAILTPPKCQAYNSTNISLATDDGQVVALDSERYDNGAMHSTVTDNSRITFTTAGIYIITFNCAFAANATGDRSAFIRKNGQDFIAMSQKHAFATQECGMSVTVHEMFEVGEFVEAIAKQDSGGALNLLATRYSPILSVRYRRPLP